MEYGAYTIDQAQFLADFKAMSRHGGTSAGGVHREAGSAADAENRHWFAGLLAGLGAQVAYDQIGNQFGFFETHPGAPYVLVGSHLDSQPFGGRFDGAYGVLAGAHACAAVSRGATRHNLAVVNWFNEEGSRFVPAMMGSGVFTGKLPLERAQGIVDRRGTSVADAVSRMNCAGELGAAQPMPEFAAYVEIHIEQGKAMHRDGHTIGLVTSTWAVRKYEIVVHGEQSHTGATLIEDRHDALLGAAMLITKVREVGQQHSTAAQPLITSCGCLDVEPNSQVTVARRATLMLDLRCADEDRLEVADQAFQRAIPEIERVASVRIEQRQSHRWGAQAYAAAGVELAESVARELGLSHVRTRTLAGHDSTNLKDVLPTIMLFIPSIEGITHNERELTSDDDMISGLRMLAGVLQRVAAAELEAQTEGDSDDT